MILTFDSSIEGFSVGLFRNDGTLINQTMNASAYAHTEFLVPEIQGLLSKCQIKFNQITKIITTKGPGSFTGVRVGLATAAGLQAALNVPVITVNTLTALICSWVQRHSHINSHIHVVLDTKCGEVYYQPYSLQSGTISPNEATRSIALDLLKEIAQNEIILTHPSTQSILGPLKSETTLLTAQGMWNAAQYAHSSDLQPLYVRSANINPSKKHV